MATLYNTYFIHCLSSVHVGDGSSSGTIDLPIQREKVTGFPVFRDSSLRGSIREYFEKDETRKKNECFDATFGNRHNGDKNSALEVFPARLLFFPVRSFNGLFAYVTCPFVLQRFLDDMKKFQNEISAWDLSKITAPKENEILAGVALHIGDSKKVGLEEFLFGYEAETDNSLQSILDWFSKETNIERIKTHGAIVNDSVFGYMAKLFTEKVTRNRIDLITGTAEGGALFNEEFLPEETVLYTALGFGNEFSKDEERKTDDKIQKYVSVNLNSPILSIGGDQSIGKGMIGLKELNT